MGKKFDETFMKDAVNHLIISGKTIDEVADSLGVSGSALGRWKLKYQATAVGSELSKDEELRRLRNENSDLRMEREILKKSIGIFSRAQR